MWSPGRAGGFLPDILVSSHNNASIGAISSIHDLHTLNSLGHNLHVDGFKTCNYIFTSREAPILYKIFLNLSVFLMFTMFCSGTSPPPFVVVKCR